MHNWKSLFPIENRFFETDNGILYCGNCIDLLHKFPKESIDLIITDPPYLINYKTNHRKDKNHDFCKPIANDDNPDVIINSLPVIYKILKQNTAFYMFGSWKTVEIFKPAINKYFKLKNIIIWVKNNWTAGDLQAQFGQQYEIIFYANKGRAFLKGKRHPDVWFFDKVNGKKQLHQNQKPLPIINRMLESHSSEFDLIADPFAGSGTTLVACEQLNRRWIGIEINPNYCGVIVSRLNKVKNG